MENNNYIVYIVENRLATKDVICVRQNGDFSEVRVMTNVNPDVLRYDILLKHGKGSDNPELAFAKWILQASDDELSADYTYNRILKLWYFQGDYTFADDKHYKLGVLINRADYRGINIINVARLMCDLYYGDTIKQIVPKIAHFLHVKMYANAQDEDEFFRSMAENIYKISKEIDGFLERNPYILKEEDKHA